MGTAPRTEPCNSAAADRHCLPKKLQPIPLGTVRRGDSGDQVGLAVGDGLASWLGDAVAVAVAVEVSRKFNWLTKSAANVPYTLSVVAYIRPM